MFATNRWEDLSCPKGLLLLKEASQQDPSRHHLGKGVSWDKGEQLPFPWHTGEIHLLSKKAQAHILGQGLPQINNASGEAFVQPKPRIGAFPLVPVP